MAKVKQDRWDDLVGLEEKEDRRDDKNRTCDQSEKETIQGG